jgi:hypothetical protein
MIRRNLAILLLSIGIVTLLTALDHSYRPSIFFYVLYPGDVLRLLITGGHGGSFAEERLASVLGFLANVCAYWLVLTCILFVFKAVSGRMARE